MQLVASTAKEACSVSAIEKPPDNIRTELEELRSALDRDVPAKIPDRNVLIATWNLRAFGDLKESWETGEKDTPKRNLHALRCIMEIVSRFDVVAIQEVRDNLKCLRHMMKALGPDWMFLMTDVTKGKAGNYERMAFIFDTRKVKLSGLACEIAKMTSSTRLLHQLDCLFQKACTRFRELFSAILRSLIWVSSMTK